MLSKLSCVCAIVALLGATPAEAQAQFGGFFCPPKPCPPLVVLAPVVIPEALAYGRDDGQVCPGDLVWEGSLQITEIIVEAREVRGFLVGPSGIVENVEIPCNEMVFAKLGATGIFSVRCKTRRSMTFEFGRMKTRSIMDVSMANEVFPPTLMPIPKVELGQPTPIPSKSYSSGPALGEPTPIEMPAPLPPLPAPTTVVPQSQRDDSVDEEEAPKPLKIRQPVAKKGATVLK